MERLLDDGQDRDARDRRPSRIDDVPEPVIRIVDVKCPAQRRVRQERTGPTSSMLPHRRGQVRDQGPRRLRVRARRHRRARLAGAVRRVLFSPVHGVLDPKQLAEWILDDRLDGAAAGSRHTGA